MLVDNLLLEVNDFIIFYFQTQWTIILRGNYSLNQIQWKRGILRKREYRGKGRDREKVKR